MGLFAAQRGGHIRVVQARAVLPGELPVDGPWPEGDGRIPSGAKAGLEVPRQRAHRAEVRTAQRGGAAVPFGETGVGGLHPVAAAIEGEVDARASDSPPRALAHPSDAGLDVDVIDGPGGQDVGPARVHGDRRLGLHVSYHEVWSAANADQCAARGHALLAQDWCRASERELRDRGGDDAGSSDACLHGRPPSDGGLSEDRNCFARGLSRAGLDRG